MTGISGLIGMRVLIFALRAGYAVRAQVRSEACARAVMKAPSIRALRVGSRLSFVIVSDLTKAGVLDNAVRGVGFIIHMASPVPKGVTNPSHEELHARYTIPIYEGEMNVLRTAHKLGKSVRRIVVTGTEASIVPWEEFSGDMANARKPGAVKQRRVVDNKSRAPTPTGPFTSDAQAYAAGKVMALNECEAWVKQEKPDFDVVHVLPTHVLGRQELATSALDLLDTTNRAVVELLGSRRESFTYPTQTVHADDVGRLHVAALKPRIPGNCCYINTSSGPGDRGWQSLLHAVKQEFPEAIESPEADDGSHGDEDGQRAVAPKSVMTGEEAVWFDASETERIFQLKHQDCKKQVWDVVEQHLELTGKRYWWDSIWGGVYTF